jgi:hypothetical protein
MKHNKFYWTAASRRLSIPVLPVNGGPSKASGEVDYERDITHKEFV